MIDHLQGPTAITRPGLSMLGLSTAATASAHAHAHGHGHGHGHGTSAAPAAPAAIPTTTFGLASLSVRSSVSDVAFLGELDRLSHDADLIGLSEVGRRRTALQQWARDHGWRLIMPACKEAGDEAMLARADRFHPVALNEYGQERVEYAGDLRSNPSARSINWVAYRERSTGRTIVHINSHASPHRDGLDAERLRHTLDGQLHIHRLRTLAAEMAQTGQVVVTTDLDMTVADPREALGNVTVLAQWASSSGRAGLVSQYGQGLSLSAPPQRPDRGELADYIYEWVQLPEYRVLRMEMAYDARSPLAETGTVAVFGLDG